MAGRIHGNTVLYFLTVFHIGVVLGDIEWKTVLLATKSSGVNINDDLFEKWGQSINRNATTNEEDSIFDIAQKLTFRSPLIDSWAVENHTYVRLGVFNKRGDLLWWVTFSGFHSDLTNWNRQTRIEMASHETLTEDTLDTTVKFSDDGINVTSAEKGWLWVFQNGGEIKMILSMRAANTFPGVGYTQNKNSAVLESRKTTPTNTFNFPIFYSMFWIGLYANTYLIGFGLEKEASGEITEFQLSYSANESCFNNVYTVTWDYYKNSSGLPMNIKPTYDASGKYYLDNMNMLTIFAKCFRIQVINTTGSKDAKATVLTYHAQGDFLQGDILAIQWGNDPSVEDPLQNVVDKIQAKLAYSKYDTARYKSRFTSATDSRPSVVVFGVLGLAIFLLVIGSIIMLDIATLRSQLKYAKRNTVVFRRKAKEKWRSFRKRTASGLAKLREKRATDGSGKTKMATASKINVKSTNGNSSQKKAKITKMTVSPKNERKTGSATNLKKGSGVSVVSASTSQQISSSTSKRPAGNAVQKKPPAVLTRISE